jgi:hypothetical protein
MSDKIKPQQFQPLRFVGIDLNSVKALIKTPAMPFVHAVCFLLHPTLLILRYQLITRNLNTTDILVGLFVDRRELVLLVS